VFKIEEGIFGLSLTAPTPTPTDACTATATSFTDFSCQITSGAISASPNVTDDTVAATWCSAESTTQQVGETSFTLDISILQDPDVSAGLSAFLFTHDTELIYWFVGMAADDPPQAYGSARCVAGTIGGEARVALTADVSLPISGKPFVCFGDATTSVPVAGTPLAMAASTFMRVEQQEPVDATV
jgi:hypothetical protein